MDACTIKGVPTAPQRLGTSLTDLYVELWDQHQNSWFNRLVPKVTFTSSRNKLSLSSQAGVWETTDPGQHRLRLPAVTVIPDKLPPDAFATNSGSASVSCTVSFTEDISDSFTLAILPGLPQKMLLSPTPAWFTTMNAAPMHQLENHESCPAFSVQLHDAWGFKATPLAAQDSVRVQIENEDEAVSNNVAELHDSRGIAKFAAMGLNLANMQQARTVQFTAELVSAATHIIAPLTFGAHILPSSKPTSAHLFWDLQLQRPLPTRSEGNATKVVVEQVAGQQIQQLYMTLHTEDGALKANPDISSVSLGRHVLFEVLASSTVQLNFTDQLKSPNSIADVKEAEMQVTGRANWEIKLQVRLESCSGVPVALALELVNSEETIQNGENISDYIVASFKDELNNCCKLPQGLLSPALSLTVRSAAEHEGASHETTPLGFWDPDTDVSNPVYVGDWLQQDGSDTLQIPKIALVGPPGPVYLTLCGAPGSGTNHLRQCVLPLTLTTGAIEQWRHEGLPEGVQPSRVEVGSMTLTPLDAGENPVELGQGNIRIKIILQGSQQESLQALSLKLARNREVISARREGPVLHIEPFELLSSAAGSHNLELHVQQQASRQWRPIGCIAFTIMTVLSNSIVQAFDIEWPPSPAASVAAGSDVPLIRFKGTAEDGSQCAAVQLAGAAKVHIKHPNKQTYPLGISCDPADSTTAVCIVSEEKFLRRKGTYQVVVESVQQTSPASSASSSFIVTAGPRHHLHLETALLEDRRCFNAGTVAQRTVFDSGVLSIRDMFDNIVTESDSICSMLAAISASVCTGGTTDTLQLTLSQVSIPLSTGTVTIGPVVVDETQEPIEGPHQIQIVLNSSSEQDCVPVRLPFNLIEASTMTQAVKDALAALHQAEQQTRDAEHYASTVTDQLNDARGTLQQRLQAARSTLPDVTATNWQEQLQLCEQRKTGVRVARVARHCHAMRATDLAELTSMDGVLGFISDLVFVEDDSDARLLSWHSMRALDLLVVTTVAAVNAVDARFPDFRPQKLVLSLIHLPSTNQSLPHSGVLLPEDLQVDVQILATRVTVIVPEAHLPSGRKDAEAKILQHVAGSLLRMHKEVDAMRYMEYIKTQRHQYCPSILCIDDGTLVSSSGVVGGRGDAYRAPMLTPSQPCYGQVAAQLTADYKFWQQAAQELQLLGQVLPQLQQCEEQHAAAQSSLNQAVAHEQQCHAAWKQAERDAEQLHSYNLSHLSTPANQRSSGTSRTGRKRGRHSVDNEYTTGIPSLTTPARPALRRRSNAEHDT